MAKHDTGLQLAALNDINLLWAHHRSLIGKSSIMREREREMSISDDSSWPETAKDEERICEVKRVSEVIIIIIIIIIIITVIININISTYFYQSYLTVIISINYSAFSVAQWVTNFVFSSHPQLNFIKCPGCWFSKKRDPYDPVQHNVNMRRTG